VIRSLLNDESVHTHTSTHTHGRARTHTHTPIHQVYLVTTEGQLPDGREVQTEYNYVEERSQQDGVCVCVCVCACVCACACVLMLESRYHPLQSAPGSLQHLMIRRPHLLRSLRVDHQAPPERRPRVRGACVRTNACTHVQPTPPCFKHPLISY
jgi:hypothetical protein